MLKLPHKILISLLLAIALWCGVDFPEKTHAARDCTVEYSAAQGQPANSPAMVAYTNCANQRIQELAIDSAKYTGLKGVLDGLKGIGKALGGVLTKIVMSVNGILLQFIVIPILSILFKLSSAFLNLTIQFTLSTEVLEMSGISLGITTIWKFIRDILNITFIFILLWASIQLIIGLSGSKTKEMIAHVIVAALLINFSLFITRVVIDAGNMLGVSIYNEISITPGVGLGTEIVNKLGLGSLWKTIAAEKMSPFSVEFGVVSYLQAATLLIGFFVFLYAGLLMASRIVVLIFLMAMSPIGFMGNVLPKLAEYSKSWRETLYGQTMIAPVFILFIYLILEISSAFSNVAALASNNLDPDDLKYAAYFKYIMVILLLIIAVKITKKMTGVIGSTIEGFGKFVAGAAVGLATGGVAMAGRQVLGRGAATFLTSKTGAAMKARADSGSLLARMNLAAMEKASKSTYDVRNVKSVGKAAGFVGDKIGIKFSAGKSSGVYSKDGKQTGFAGARKAEEEKANKAYDDAEKSVSNKDKIEASGALYTRDQAVKTKLAANAAHTNAEAEINRLKQDGITTHADMRAKESELSNKRTSLAVLLGSNNPVAIEQARKSVADAEKARDEQKTKLENENMQRHAQQISLQQKIIEKEKRETVRAVENDTSIISKSDKAKIDRVERARNLADSYRKRGRVLNRGRLGTFNFASRNEEIASGMENHKKKTQEEELLEELREARKELKEKK